MVPIERYSIVIPRQKTLTQSVTIYGYSHDGSHAVSTQRRKMIQNFRHAISYGTHVHMCITHVCGQFDAWPTYNKHVCADCLC